MSTPIENNSEDLRSVLQKVNTVQENIVDAFAAIGNNGGIVPSEKTSGNLVYAISTIPGVKLNFDVVAYNTLDQLMDSTPKTNTLGIVTTTPISGWIFSADQPTDMSNGAVWITTGTESVCDFNALISDSGIDVYPISAKQYVNAEYVNVDGYCYQNNLWTQFSDAWDGKVYEKGNQYTEITGGWSAMNRSITASFGSNKINFADNSASGNDESTVYTKKLIDVTNFSRLEADVTITSAINTPNYAHLGLTSTNTNTSAVGRFVASNSTSTTGTLSVDLSTVKGSYYIALGMEKSVGSVTRIQLL